MATYYVELDGGQLAPKTTLKGGDMTPKLQFEGAVIYPTSGGGGSATLQTKSVTYTPSELQQTEQVTPDQGYDGLDKVNVTVNPISSMYVGSEVPRQSGSTITPTTTTQTAVPAGTFVTGYVKVGAMPTGSASTPTTTITATPNLTVSASGLITASVNASKSITPNVTPGYVQSGTAGTVSASGSKTQQLTTKAAETFYPAAANQTVNSGQYLVGKQTFSGVQVSNLLAENIKKDVVVQVGDSANPGRIKSVVGTYEGGGGGLPTAPDNDVNFIDYDGTIRYSYTKAEFANLSALPANPTHSGLTSQGWNWTLSDAQTFVAQYGVLDIGQMYVTDDGATRLYVEVRGTAYRPTAKIRFGQSVSNGVTVDWGDGSATQTYSHTGATIVTHDYATDGEYVISLKPSTGCTLQLSGSWNACVMGVSNASVDGVNSASLKKFECGSNVTIGAQTFQNNPELEAITLSTSVTSLKADAIFHSARVLRALVVPSSVTEIGGANYFASCNLERISLPNSITSVNTNGIGGNSNWKRVAFAGSNWYIAGALNGSASVREVVLPTGAIIETSASLNACRNLTTLTIPSNYTTIAAYAFQNNYGMKEYHFLATTPPTLSNTNAFTWIQSDCKIYVPSASLSDYQTASNWSTYASYMVGE